MVMQVPLFGLNGHKVKSTHGRLTLSTLELRAHLNLTRVTKKKETTPERHVLIPECKKHTPEKR